MDFIETSGLSFSQLNETIRHAGKECRICACQGQRFIAAGMSSKRLEIDGIPGNQVEGISPLYHVSQLDGKPDNMAAVMQISTRMDPRQCRRRCGVRHAGR